MRLLFIIGLVAFAVGCSTTDPVLTDHRLIGTWRSDREKTMANLFQRDPSWTNATPENLQKLRSVFGQMTITYGKGTIVAHYGAREQQLGYTVVERGPDYVVIQIKGGVEDGQQERLRFVDGDKAYWIQSLQAANIEERFDKVSP
jgi:hypothetical protein